MEIWYKSRCLKCQAANWTYGGDPEDCTSSYPDGVRCRLCGHIEYFEEDILRDNHQEELAEGEKLEDLVNVWTGKERP